MFKQFFKTLILGLTSGAAVAAGGWAWKNVMEAKANELKQKCDEQQKNASSKTKED